MEKIFNQKFLKSGFILIFVAWLGFMLSPGAFAQLNKDVEYYKGKIISYDQQHHKIIVQRADGAQRTFSLDGARYPSLFVNNIVIVIVPYGSDRARSVRMAVKL